MHQATTQENATHTTRHPEQSPERYWSMKEIADHLVVSIHTPRKWLLRKQMLRPDINGIKLNRWKYSTIKDFLENPIKWRKEHAQEVA
ncbi:MAG: hypothetical protein GX070_05660 [Alcaligenaceae bacterium]|nr:hypothetical protein [Alcaligenaceae bacterium]